MHITVLSGGTTGARFARGVLDHLTSTQELADSTLTVVVNTGDDVTLWNLRACPDIDAHLAELGPDLDTKGDDGHRVRDELTLLGAGPGWYPATDREVATHLARTAWLGRGESLSEVTARLAGRRGVDPRVTVLPMSDVPVETHAVLDIDDEQQALHVQQWRHDTGGRPERFIVAGMDRATPAPGALDAVRGADAVLLAPSDPVVSLGIVLGVPGMRDALRGTTAPVVGVSPTTLVDLTSTLATADTPPTAAATAGLYRDLLDGWLVDPGEELPRGRWASRISGEPITLDSPASAARTAAEAVALARELSTT